MKRKNIVLSLLGILIMSVFVVCLVGINKKQYIMKDGMMLALTLDGKDISEFPEGTNYKVDIECDNARGTWLVEEWKLSIDDITGNVICNIDFHTRKKTDTLLSVVSNTANYDPIMLSNSGLSKISKSNYLKIKNDSNNPFQYNDENNTWDSTNISELADREFSFKLDDGLYQFCYYFRTTDYSSYLDLSSNLKGNLISVYDENSEVRCSNIGYVNSKEVLTLDYDVDEEWLQYVTAVDFGFYIQEYVNPENIDNYRYQGYNPDNYIWFNNELWRIIGSVPACTSSECSTSEDLVKIIRDGSIGINGYASSSRIEWQSSSLNVLLNQYYYGARNATRTEYCIDYDGTSNNAKCDYTAIGINPDSYYGKMVKNIYWNTGSANSSDAAEEIYINETENQTHQGYIGLLYLSDYIYVNQNRIYDEFEGEYYYSENWLENTYFITHQSISNLYYYQIDGSFGSAHGPSGYGNEVRPVVYLDSDVYVVSGDGTEGNPYQITM